LILACSLLPSLLLIGACERSSTTSSPEPEAPTKDPAPIVRHADGEHAMPYGERTIYVYADPALAPEVARLFALLEDLRSEQVPIDATTRLPIGWTTLSFAVEGERGERLVVQEPDYENQPETHTRQDISVSLATLARQRAVLEHAGVAGQPINFDEHVLAIRGALELEEVFLLRVDSPGGRMSGWRLSPTEGFEPGSETESIPVYAILEQRPTLVDAMLLPPGYVAFYSGAALTTIMNESDEVVWDWTLAAPELERDADPQPLLEPI
jgi:hypothetical protein